MQIIERYQKEIEGEWFEITVEHHLNHDFPYHAVSTPLNISGSGKTIEKARESCEGAVKIELKLNR